MESTNEISLTVSTFPTSYHLVVTTTKGVYTWTHRSISEIFHSGSEGIVAAKRLSDEGDLLAVADSHIVVLHDIARGMQQSYRLKGTDGEVRFLRYQPESQNLLFTTTLHNAIQSYSLRDCVLLDPSHVHPSPPTIFALSPTSHLLLSASKTPPTIYIANLLLNKLPIQLLSSVSSSAVVAAAFHPDRTNVFVLAFADSVVVAYDATLLLYINRHPLGTSFTPLRIGSMGEIGHLKKLHAVGLGGITAIAFVPGSTCTIITVGGDGKCRVVDFESRPPKVVQSWYLGAVGTSISILPQMSTNADFETGNSTPITPILVAIGRQDGIVLVFSLKGNLLWQGLFSSSTRGILDVEWHAGSGERSENVNPISKSATKSTDNLFIEPSAKSVAKRIPPKIPATRPVGRKGGKLSLRRAETAKFNALAKEDVRGSRVPNKQTASKHGRDGDEGTMIGREVLISNAPSPQIIIEEPSRSPRKLLSRKPSSNPEPTSRKSSLKASFSFSFRPSHTSLLSSTESSQPPTILSPTPPISPQKSHLPTLEATNSKTSNPNSQSSTTTNPTKPLKPSQPSSPKPRAPSKSRPKSKHPSPSPPPPPPPLMPQHPHTPLSTNPNPTTSLSLQDPISEINIYSLRNEMLALRLEMRRDLEAVVTATREEVRREMGEMRVWMEERVRVRKLELGRSGRG